MSLSDEEAEQIVIGSLLQNSEIFSEISDILRPEDFFYESHRTIFNAIAEERDNQNKPDLLLIIAHLKQRDLLAKVGNRSYLTKVAGLSSPFSATTYAKTVKDFAMRRQLLGKIKEVEKNTHDNAVSVENLLSETEKAIFSVSDRHSTFNVQHVKSVKDEFTEFIRNVKESDGGITGTPTGFGSFDQMTSGLKGGQLMILAARPGVGKTTLALNIARNVAQKSGKGVLVFSLEMTKLELLIRLVCAEAHLEAQRIQKGRITDREMKRIVEACKSLFETDLYIDDSADLSSWEFKQRSRRLNNNIHTQDKELGLIVVDYLQLMTDKGGGGESRQIEVANISRSLKLIAKDLNVPVLALSQMNRSIEQRGKDPRPQLSDLRESGAIEQDADIVGFLHRQEMFDKDLPDSEKGMAELIIAKHRAGPTGSIKLGFMKEHSVFMEVDYSETEVPA